MKKGMLKNCLVAALGFAMIAFAGLGVVTASAAEITSLDDINFEMIKGASIRVDESEVTGIRFSAKMDLDELAWLNENYKTVRFGTFIMPSEYGSFSATTLFSKDASFYWEGGAEPKEGQQEILQMYSKVYEFEDEETGETYARINGSILEVDPSNYDRAFIGVGYMELTDNNGDTIYKLAKANDNERTILYVAQRALEEEDWAETDSEYINTQSFLDAYIKDNPDATVQYTLQKIYPDKSGGAPTVVTEKKTAPFNEEVILTEEACAEDYYLIDKAASVMSGTAYAQDKLTLTVRYGFKIEADGIALHGTGSAAYAIDRDASKSDKWTMLASGGSGHYIGVTITSAYVKEALANGAKQLIVAFGNNAGSGFGFDANSPAQGTIIPDGATATNSVAKVTIPLDANKDYSAGLDIRFYNHDGVGPGCTSLWMTIEQFTTVTAFRNTNTFSVAYQGDDVWRVNKGSQQNIAYVITKDYIDSLIAKGAKGMSVKFEAMDPSEGIKFSGNYYVQTPGGVSGAGNTNTDCCTFDKTNLVWTVDFTKITNWNGYWGSDWTGATTYNGVACHMYLVNGAGNGSCKNVLIKITPIY